MATRSSHNKNNSAVKRILQEAKELQNDPSTDYSAAPLEEDIFEWHCTIRGPPDTEFEGGMYHCRVLLPSEYPFKAPSIMLLTPNGRFELNKKICISFTSYHEELWQPAWGIRTAIIGLQGFFPLKGEAATGVGALEFPTAERKRLAALSKDWVCPHCQEPNHTFLRTNAPSPTPAPLQIESAPVPAPPPAAAASSATPPSSSSLSSGPQFQNPFQSPLWNGLPAPPSADSIKRYEDAVKRAEEMGLPPPTPPHNDPRQWGNPPTVGGMEMRGPPVAFRPYIPEVGGQAQVAPRSPQPSQAQAQPQPAAAVSRPPVRNRQIVALDTIIMLLMLLLALLVARMAWRLF